MNTAINQLMDAVYKNDIPRLYNLLSDGASPNGFNNESFAPLHFSAELKRDEATNLLLSYGANPNVLDTNSMTPLQYAAADGSIAIAAALLAHAADPNIALENPSDRPSPLAYASQNSHLEMIRLLVQHGAVLDEAGEDGITPLCNAAGAGDLAVVRLLLDLGADINHREKVGTALHNACAYGHAEIVHELISRGADVNAVNADGDRPNCSAFPAVQNE